MQFPKSVFLLTALLLLSAGGAHAEGTADGIYQCDSDSLGQTYVSVVTSKSPMFGNQTVFTVAALTQYTAGLYGYGMGQVTTTNGVTTFAGKTMFNTAFDFSVYPNGGMSGTITVLYGKVPTMVSVDCARIF